jgi:hypothetical protein
MSLAHDPAGTRLLARAFDGPIDVVGDVHGEIEALESLLRVLGYAGQGEHAQARRLVFIGDLCDRGPDSPAVVRRVGEMVQAGTAQCLLGNHELNVLRGARKEANGWYFADDHDRAAGRFTDSRPAADDAERAEIARFFRTMPLALERPDLRLVHACWDDDRLGELRADGDGASAVELYRLHALRSDQRARGSGLADEVEALLERYGRDLRDAAAQVPMLDALAARDVDYQMSNPIRVLTSGAEHRADAPFFMAGKWRMVQRSDWWEQYRSPTPVLFGHYWRWPTSDAGERFGRYAVNPFPGREFDEWTGAADTAFCIDYCIGGRFAERRWFPQQPYRSRLGAVRWPEREVLFENGSGAEMVPPRGVEAAAVRTAR